MPSPEDETVSSPKLAVIRPNPQDDPNSDIEETASRDEAGNNGKEYEGHTNKGQDVERGYPRVRGAWSHILIPPLMLVSLVHGAIPLS